MTNLTKIDKAAIIANAIYAKIKMYLDLNIPNFSVPISKGIIVMRKDNDEIYMVYGKYDTWTFTSKPQLINRLKKSSSLDQYINNLKNEKLNEN